jgi:protoporphyrinogen oxidase
MTLAAKNQRLPVVVLGAGLTGMSAALSLEGSGTSYRLFEKQASPGGHVTTTWESGYGFDRTGHLLHLRDPAIKRDVLEWIGDDYEIIQRRSVIFSHGVYTRYPFQANTYGLPPAVANECLLGFLKAHFSQDKPTPKNFEEFCLVHFGEGFSKHFMIPYNARLWGVAPSEITSAWCQRFVPLPKLEDVIAGAVGLNDRELGYNANFVYPRRGIGVLTDGMARCLPRMELGRAPRHIDLRDRVIELDDERVPFDVLVSTAPLPSLIELLAPVPDVVREAARRLRCSHLYYLDVALNRQPGKDFHWAYVPEERYPFYRVGCYSHFSAALAPENKGSLYVELASRAAPELGRLLPEVTAGLSEMGVIEGERDIAFARVRRIDHAYVIFDHDYYEALATVRAFLEENRLISAGRYGGWNYSSMEDAISFGRDAVKLALELLS